jgi:hypothetical protein
MTLLADILTAPADPPDDDGRLYRVTENGQTRMLTAGEMRARLDERKRAADELTARADARRAERKAAQEEAQRQHLAAVDAAIAAELRTEARAAFPGSDADFDAAWPTLKPQIQQAKALAELGRRQQEAVQRLRSVF